MDTIKIVLMIIAVVGVVVLGILELWTIFKGRSVWKEVADRFGFSQKTTGKHADKRMRGTHRGVELSLRGRTDYEEVGRGIKKSRHPRYFTVFRARLGDRWEGKVEVLPRDRPSITPGPSTQITGYDAFDKQYEVGGRVPEQLAIALQDAEALRALQRLKNTFGDFQIVDGQIFVEVEKRFTSKEQFVSFIEELVAAALGLREAAKRAEEAMERPETAVDEFQESESAMW